MKPIAISIMQTGAGQEEPGVVETIAVEPTAPEDWQLPPDALRRKNEESWRSVNLPNGETIQVGVAISTANDGFSLAVRQAGEELAQLLCEGKPFLAFRTFDGQLIGIQVFDREQFEEAKKQGE